MATYPCGDDYSTDCGEMPQSFIQMLANCIVGYTCDEEVQYRVNMLPQFDYCDELSDFWTCDNNHIDPERALVENTFALDPCGRLAWKIFLNQGEAPQ